MTAAHVALALVVSSLCACGSDHPCAAFAGETCIDVLVTSSEPLTFDELRVSPLSGLPVGGATSVPVAATSTPAVFALLPGESVAGPFSLAVTAIVDQTATAAGTGAGEVERGQDASIVVELVGDREECTIWEEVALPPSPTPFMRGIWGTGPDDVYVVGQYAVGFHRVDATWYPLVFAGVADTTAFNEVWGTPDGAHVFVITDDGQVLHSTDRGETWQSTVLAAGVELHGIWGSSASDVYVVGNGGALFHFDGETWSPLDAGTSSDLIAVWGSGPSDVYVGGGCDCASDPARPPVLRHRDASGAWDTPFVPDATIKTITGTGPNDVFAADTHVHIEHFDGIGWLPLPQELNSTEGVNSIWTYGAGVVYAGGSQGGVVRWDGQAWTRSCTSPSVPSVVFSIWGSGPRDIYAGSTQGRLFHRVMPN